jgi:RNA polymerase sigma-70 factor (ECF subfamily)
MDVIEAFKSQFGKLTATLRRRGSSAADAEDLVQEAFLRLLNYIEKGEQVQGAEAFLNRVVINAFIDLGRRERKRVRVDCSAEELVLPDAKANPEQDVADIEYLRRTANMLDRMVGKRARRVFHLCCFDEMTHTEVGRQLKISVATVQRDYLRALRALSMSEPHKRHHANPKRV